MKKIVLLFVLFASSFSYAQENYKYVIVPKKFNFFKEENKYNLNTITKFFFEKEGFQVIYDTEEFPDDLAANRCSALYINVLEKSNMVMTKITFEIKDCQNRLIIASVQGESREKQYEKAYNESFREALVSMRGKLNIKTTEIIKAEEVSVGVSEIKTSINSIIDVSQLRAVPTETGYNLINHTNNIVVILNRTSLENVFIASKDIFKGVLIKKNTGWFFEYDFEGKVYSEKIEVKF